MIISSASSAENTRPRNLSGTDICSRTVLKTHSTDPAACAPMTAALASRMVGDQLSIR